MSLSEQKYKVGDKVIVKSRPDVQLTIRRFVDRIYYCRLVSDPGSPDHVYFERELAAC